MENYIDLINAYLQKSLTEPEILAFENKLQIDTDFNAIYKEHLVMLNGIRRVVLKQEINEAKRSYVRGKWFKIIGGLIGTLILITLVWLFVFNNGNKAKDEIRESLNFENEFVQTFETSSDSIIHIVGKKGTRLTINRNDLEFKSKKQLTSENLTIQLIELTNKQDLLLANTQTLSNGKWLISGGAFKIEIKTDNEILKLKKGKTISAQFPKNTNEEGMQIFYGDRDDNGYLNWDLSNVKLENEKYFTIQYKDTSMIDMQRTRRFGGVETYITVIKIDSLGYITKEEIENNFPSLVNFENQKDTIRIYRHFEYIDSLTSEDLLRTDSIITDIINDKDYEKNKEWFNDKNNFITDDIINSIENSKTVKSYNNTLNNFYKSIEISKLGWINIDKFYNAEDNITINLKNNLGINFNLYSEETYPVNSEWPEIYLIDNENNTILNIYSSKIDIPRGNYTIISFCIVEDEFYTSRKKLKADKDGNFMIDYKKSDKSQIKSLLRLDTNSVEEENLKQQKVSITKKEVEALIVEKETANQNDESTDNTLSFFNSNYKAPQKNTVNTEEDFKITLKEGTKISIPKRAFIDAKTSKQVTGNIELSITEYYKLSDMLLADLSTTSNGKILETGGMLYIEAKKNGSKLKLKPEVEMNIIFNSSGKQDMQLFTGEKDDSDEINWKLNEPKVTSSEVAVIDFLTGSIDKTVHSFDSVDNVPVFPGCENGTNTEKKQCMKVAINKLINRKFNSDIAENLNLTGNHKINTSFDIDEEGSIVNIVAKAYRKELAEEAIRIIESFPKLKPGSQNGKPVVVKYYLPMTFTIIDDPIMSSRGLRAEQDTALFTLRSDKKFIESFESSLESNIGNNKIKESDIDRYTFAISQLGWINCDRFVNSRKKKIKYKVKVKDAEGANVKMVFKSMSSILPSYRIDEDYSFGEIPIDENVILLAIKKKGNKLFLGMKEVKTEMISELDLEFKVVTIAELKAELYKLNEGF